MSSKTYEIGDLRDKLFKQLEKLDDPNCDFEKELKRSEAFVSIGNVIVNSAKTEVDYMRVIGAGKNKEGDSGFIGHSKQLKNSSESKTDK